MIGSCVSFGKTTRVKEKYCLISSATSMTSEVLHKSSKFLVMGFQNNILGYIYFKQCWVVKYILVVQRFRVVFSYATRKGCTNIFYHAIENTMARWEGWVYVIQFNCTDQWEDSVE